MKRLLSLFIAITACIQMSFAYDFSAVAPSGQTLYYQFVSSGVSVTYPSDGGWGYYEKPTGHLTIPDSVVYGGNYYLVIGIDYDAFSGCSGLTSVTIGNSVTYIGNYAFSGCSGLTSVTIGNSVTYIGTSFYNCSSLTSVTIGNSVTSIGERAFSGCSGLTSVTIPNSVTSIGKEAFYGCSSLTSVTIGNSVTSIGNYAFAGCSGLTSINIPNSVTSIGIHAFGGCSGLTSVTIPNSVTSIVSSAFYGCSGLTSVTIPNSVTSIGESAFSGCSGLTSVTIPNSVTSIGDYAFSGVRHIEYYGISSGAPWGALSMNGVTDGDFIFSNSNKDTLTAYVGAGSTITIPSTVTTIGNYAFFRCNGLTSVTIPNSVTSIGESAFSGCSGLTSVTIGRAVKSIGLDAFKNCNALASVEYNADSCVFINSKYGLFYYSQSTITNFTFGDNVKIIPAFLCYNLSGLTSITLPTDVSYIGERAFSGCSGLTSIQIPDNATSIGEGSFSGCDHLTNVTFGNGLQTIGGYAFGGCTQVVRIKSHSTEAPTVQSNTFSDLSDNVVVNVPCGSASVYENAAYWLRFDIQEDLMYTFSVTSGNPSQGTVQVIKQPTCDDAEAVVQAHAYHNYHFVRWSDGNTDSLRYIVVTQDTAIQAEFAEGSGTEGIDNIKDDDILIYSIDGRIHVVVGNHPQDEFRVFDAMGRDIFYTTQGDETPQFPAGVYLVKLKGLPARKVVVIR